VTKVKRGDDISRNLRIPGTYFPFKGRNLEMVKRKKPAAGFNLETSVVQERIHSSRRRGKAVGDQSKWERITFKLTFWGGGRGQGKRKEFYFT